MSQPRLEMASLKTRRQRAALLSSAAGASALEEEISRVAEQSGFNADTVRRGLIRR